MAKENKSFSIKSELQIFGKWVYYKNNDDERLYNTDTIWKVEPTPRANIPQLTLSFTDRAEQRIFATLKEWIDLVSPSSDTAKTAAKSSS